MALRRVFDSDCNIENEGGRHTGPTVEHRGRKRLPLSLNGVAASGRLPSVREAEKIDGGYYWDGLCSQNPPIREFLAGVQKEHVPDELWVVRINPQQCAKPPQTNVAIRDRENELMGSWQMPAGFQPPEAFCRLHHGSPGPAQRHGSIFPAFDVAADAADRAVHVLDDVGAGQRAAQFGRQAQAADGETDPPP
jgi:predicted acylesterase/phospholipase RssA